MPGNTQWSWAVSKTRIRLSKLSKSILPLLNHKACLVELDIKELIETVAELGPFEPTERAIDGFVGHDAVAALGVASQAGFNIGLKVVADRAELSRLRRFQEGRSFAVASVGVVDHAGLAQSEAGLKERALAMARFEHIEVDAHMAVKKALFVEARFARGLQTYKQNQFHARVCATFV